MSQENNPEHHPYLLLDDDAIRVVRIEPDSTEADIRCSLLYLRRYQDDDVASYTALSYCWGDAKDTRSIMLGGRTFTVTTNLWNALASMHNIMQQHSYYIWVDAICINQSDLEERNSQVRKMWQIFRSAKLVISWLGGKDGDTDAVFDAADVLRGQLETHPVVQLGWETEPFIYVPFEGEDPTKEDGIPTIVSRTWGRPLLDLCCRDYFGRAWIIPEILHAQEAVLLCGDRWMAWSLFEAIVLKAQRFWDLASENTLPAIILRSQSLLQAVKICEVRSMRSSGRELHGAEEVFYDVLDFYAISSCSDVRDHVFALMTDPRIWELELLKDFRADYALTPEQLYLLVLAQLTSLIRAGSHQVPGPMYDQACVPIGTALKIDVSSIEYYDWLSPQIVNIHDVGRTSQATLYICLS